jgi:hypothetical protein
MNEEEIPVRRTPAAWVAAAGFGLYIVAALGAHGGGAGTVPALILAVLSLPLALAVVVFGVSARGDSLGNYFVRGFLVAAAFGVIVGLVALR